MNLLRFPAPSSPRREPRTRYGGPERLPIALQLGRSVPEGIPVAN